ncbi:MAG: antitoxin Xre-like helix-turn-helix domain-containing protein, partial [Geminicoccales bacterium]
MVAQSSALRQDETTTAPREVAALRAFFRLAELWGLTMEQARVLLGRPARATLYNWKAGRVRALP